MTSQNIIGRLQEHLDKVKETYNNNYFVICLQGSQNYGIADKESDIDSKCLILPTAEDLIFNNKPISHTLIMDNDEHCDVKDIREYFKIVRKSNINFVEIFFTDYYIVNPQYEEIWDKLRDNAETIARINPYRAVSAMRGMALEKYHALEHEYPSRMHMIEKFGYDPKQLSHLFRIEAFMKAFLQNAYYKSCIQLTDEAQKIIYKVKRYGWEYYNSDKTYKEVADISLSHIEELYQKAKKIYENKDDPKALMILDIALWQIMEKELREELL